MTNLLIAAGLCLAAATPTLAQEAPDAPNVSTSRAKVQAQLKEVFTRADTDHDGFMSRKEFAARMTAILNRTPPGSKGAPTKEQVQRMVTAANAAFDAADTNHDGKLSLAESSKRTLGMFDAADADHDGILTPAEKAAVRQKLDAKPKASGPQSR